MFILQAFGVDSQTRISLTNLKAGQHRAAVAGKLPAGVGSGILGYTLTNKRFEPNSFIGVCEEVLDRGYNGETINRITGDLQMRGIRMPSGKLITRRAVALILQKAKRYSGIWSWGGHEITALIPPCISVAKADTILANLRRNREKSFGFGKRKWLTGRVICGLCGRKWKLRAKRYCECIRSDPLAAHPPCPSPRIMWSKLGDRVWFLLAYNLMHLDVVRLQLAKRREEWERKKVDIEHQVEAMEKQAESLKRQHRLYSWQHANGVIGDQELLDAIKGIQGEEGLLLKRLHTLKHFLNDAIPPSPDKVDEWAKLWPVAVALHYENASDDIKDRLAEAIDLTVTVFPGNSQQSYRLQLAAKIPLNVQSIFESSDSLQMVSTSQGKGAGG